METHKENWLAIAIRRLKAEGIIRRDKDVAERTGYSKETISNMLSGRSDISHKFKTKFEEVFGSFENQNKLSIGVSAESTHPDSDLKDKLIKLLEERVELLIEKCRKDEERIRELEAKLSKRGLN